MDKRIKHSAFLFILIAGITAFSVQPPHFFKFYVFLGHTYQTNSKVDKRLEKLNYSLFDQVWLGGDVCAETTKKKSTVNYVNKLFKLGKKSTHWTLGNHDIRNDNIDWITNLTNRETYYCEYVNGVTIMVLNTTFYLKGYDTLETKRQFEFIERVCDTIDASSHLIVLSHNAPWMSFEDTNHYRPNTDGSWMFFNFDPILDYCDGVYPNLQKVAQRGIKVIHVAGDFGQRSATYSFETEDGIQFLGSGISSNTSYHEKFPTHGTPDSILVFRHDVIRQTIDWEYVELQ